jgi:hypothetical protein
MKGLACQGRIFPVQPVKGSWVSRLIRVGGKTGRALSHSTIRALWRQGLESVDGSHS